jgi:hypothetical protein
MCGTAPLQEASPLDLKLLDSAKERLKQNRGRACETKPCPKLLGAVKEGQKQNCVLKKN